MDCQVKSVSLEKTGLFSKLFLDYVNGENSLLNFCHDFPDISAIHEQAPLYSIPLNQRKILKDTTQSQYSGITISESLSKNLHLLGKDNTFTVCTGHQLCLFTGPSYFIYKIISCIQLCDELNKTSHDKIYVPVYWMASEDHDIEEINHVHVFGKKIEWITNGSGRAGKLLLEELEAAINQLEDVLGKNKFSTDIIQKLKSFFASSATLADFTRKIVNEIFGKYGLIILDPDDRKLKELFIPQVEMELFGDRSISLINFTNEELKQKGYHSQVNAREINLFYTGQHFRERIIAENDIFKVNNTAIQWTKDELKKVIYSEPENFSPNVILRPLYQQSILPNVAYVGGPAEISYWLQYKRLFLSRQICYPFLISRRFITILDNKHLELWKSFGFDIQDFFKPQDFLIKDYISSLPSDFNLQKQKKQVEDIFDEIMKSASTFDSGFHTFLNAERQKVMNSFDAIENKIYRNNRQKSEVSINKIKSARNKTLPNNILQERYENIFSFISNYGFEFIDQIFQVTKEKSLTEKNELIFLII